MGFFDDLKNWLTPQQQNTLSHDLHANSLTGLLGGNMPGMPPAGNPTGRPVQQTSPDPFFQFPIREQTLPEGAPAFDPRNSQTMGMQGQGLPVGDSQMEFDPTLIDVPPGTPGAPQPPPQQQQQPVIPVPRGIMEQFIEQLPELALNAFGSLRAPIRYKGTGGFIGLGALRGMQNMAQPFAQSLGQERVRRQKETEAQQAVAQLAQVQGLTPQQTAVRQAEALVAQRAPVGEMIALRRESREEERQAQYRDIIQRAAPELGDADPVLRALAISDAQQGKFDRLVDVISGERLSPQTRLEIMSGNPLTHAHLVEISRLPSQYQDALIKANQAAADRNERLLPKPGQLREKWLDTPRGPMTVKQEWVIGPDGRGRWEQFGDPVPKFRPDNGVERATQFLLEEQRRSAILAREHAALSREQKALEDQIMPPPGSVKSEKDMIAWQTRRAEKQKQLDERWERYRRASENLISLPSVSEGARQPAPSGQSAPAGKTSNVPPPPGSRTMPPVRPQPGQNVGDKLPPAASMSGVTLTNPQTGQKKYSDGTKWIDVK